MDQPKPRKSRRQTKAEARRALRDRRHGLSGLGDSDDDSAGGSDGGGAGGRGQLAGLDLEEEDAYEEMDEGEYQRHVAERMEREDFVVDDGASSRRVLFVGIGFCKKSSFGRVYHLFSVILH